MANTKAEMIKERFINQPALEVKAAPKDKPKKVEPAKVPAKKK